MTGHTQPQRLADAVPELERILMRPAHISVAAPPLFGISEIRCVTTMVTMRDGIRLATDLYLPPKLPAPAILRLTPYGRAADRTVGSLISLARRGYVVVSQDCRGTGDSDPDSWDYYMYESEDGFDLVEWATKQSWFDGFLGACGASYVGQTQWCMAMHPSMSTIVPEVSGLGIAVNTAHLYMFVNAYARTIGKGEDKVSIPRAELERRMVGETLAGGYFNEPLHKPLPSELLVRYPVLRTLQPSHRKRWLWEHYCGLPSAQRAEFVRQVMRTKNVSMADVESLSEIFGHRISHDAHTVPNADPGEACRTIHSSVLLHTGWYDWALNDTLATWKRLRREAPEPVRTRSRLLISPSAHAVPGYHEDMERHFELQRTHYSVNDIGLLLRWYAMVRDGTTDSWPTVVYYLMGANEWHVASDWPPPEASPFPLYLGPKGSLVTRAQQQPSDPGRYAYNPKDPTPTVGGSIVSDVYPPGSVDVSEVQQRQDVVIYTTPVLEQDLDVVGPLRMILYASSSAVDTDFVARLSDVFPDGRAIQLQSGILRARYRNIDEEPELLEPGRIYRFEIDMWATANRFKAGHRLRVDISSADFPHFDRNSNCAGEPGDPIVAHQTIYHDPEHPSCLLASVLSDGPI